MKTISHNKLLYFLIGSLILIPLNFFLLKTQIFYVQTSLVIILLTYFISVKRKMTITIGRGSLMRDVLYYLGWMLFSFLLNFVFSFDDIETQSRRIISLGIAFLLSSGFFVGRLLHNIDSRSLVRGIFFTYFIVLLYIGLVFLSQPSLDLYVVRRVIGQRLPFVIAFVSSLAAVYFFLEKPKKLLFFLMMSLGILTVIFSLTRAAYIQIFISFFILFIKEIRKYFFRGLLIVTMFFAVGFVFLELFREYPSVKQVTSRVELLFDYKAQSSQDVSGSYRLIMWKFLFDKLVDNPIRFVIGYGQLGPTIVGKDLVLPDGSQGEFNAHNQYLDTVIREGLVGLFFFLWICYKVLRSGLSIKLVSAEEKSFIMANSIGLAGVMFYSFFHETFRYPLFGFYFWLYLGIFSKIVENMQSGLSMSYKDSSVP